MAPVPFFSLAPMHAELDLAGAVGRVLESRQYILGPEVLAFERAFADFCGVRECVGVANGTDALELTLRGLGVGPGDRVAIVANAAGYSSAAVHAVGAAPTWVDVDDDRSTMSPARLVPAIASGVAAVIVTHLYGQLAEMDSILAVARSGGTPVIEDCAQSHGARFAGRVAGSFGVAGCYSFYPTKNLGAVGDGGAIVTDDPDLAMRVRALRQYGWSQKYRADTAGGRNSRLDELQAAVLLEKLRHLDGWNRERREIAARYTAGLSRLPVRVPASLGEDYVAHLYVIRLRERDRLLGHLKASRIGADIHYPIPDHRQSIHASETPPPELPMTDEACATVLSLPCYPGLTGTDQDMVIEAVISFFGQTI